MSKKNKLIVNNMEYESMSALSRECNISLSTIAGRYKKGYKDIELIQGRDKKQLEGRDKVGRFTTGRTQYNRKLTLDQVREIKQLLNLGYSTYKIAKDFNISQANVMYIKQGKSYRDI